MHGECHAPLYVEEKVKLRRAKSPYAGIYLCLDRTSFPMTSGSVHLRLLRHHACKNAEQFVAPFNCVGSQIYVELLSYEFEEEPVYASRGCAVNARNVVAFFGIEALGGHHLRDALSESVSKIIPFRFNEDNGGCLERNLVWRQTDEETAHPGESLFVVNVKVNARKEADVIVKMHTEFDEYIDDKEFGFRLFCADSDGERDVSLQSFCEICARFHRLSV